MPCYLQDTQEHYSQKASRCLDHKEDFIGILSNLKPLPCPAMKEGNMSLLCPIGTWAQAEEMLHSQGQHRTSWLRECHHLITPYTNMHTQIIIIISILPIYTGVETTVPHAQLIKVWLLCNLPGMAIRSPSPGPKAKAQTWLSSKALVKQARHFQKACVFPRL